MNAEGSIFGTFSTGPSVSHADIAESTTEYLEWGGEDDIEDIKKGTI